MTNELNFLTEAKRVLELEAQAIFESIKTLNDDFVEATHLILKCKGKVIVLGIGKSAHIGNKIAATLASTGTPSFFVHAAEAAHGDLGMITATDLVLAISYSGESDEIIKLIPALKKKEIKMISITNHKESSLGKSSDIVIISTVKKEACPLGLAPTTSTTLALALGDALAICLLKARGFTSSDFAVSHPAGSLGKRLILKIRDIMHQKENLPVVKKNALLKDAVVTISEKRMGFTVVTDEGNYPIGIFTDGDLRRVLCSDKDFLDTPIKEVMSKNPFTVNADELAFDCLNLMHEKKITALIAVDQNQKLIGAINIHDILATGMI